MPSAQILKTKKNKRPNGHSRVGKEVFDPKPHFVPMQEGTSLEEIRKDVFLDRYSLKDVDGKALEEYPEQMWRRVAWGIAQTEIGLITG